MHPHEYKKLREASGKHPSHLPEPSQQGAQGSPALPPPSRGPPGRYLRAPGAALYLGLSPSTLAKMRLRGDGPAYSKAGPRVVIYDRADLDAWLAGRKRRSTSEADQEEARS